MLHMLDVDRPGAVPELPGAPCGDCRNRGPACAGCVFSAVIREPGDVPRGFEADEVAAIAALAGQGLVPPLRLAPARAA